MPLRFEACVDGQNRLLTGQALQTAWAPVRAAYRSVRSEKQLVVEAAPGAVADWLLEKVK